MRDVSSEVIGRQLGLRIEPVDAQILRPLRQFWPEALCESCAVLHSSESVYQDDHVPALFHGHLVLLCLLAPAVKLSVSQRIHAQIMRSEGELPALWNRSILQHRKQLRFKQLRIQKKKQRRRGIQHVDSRDAAVGEVLFAE